MDKPRNDDDISTDSSSSEKIEQPTCPADRRPNDEPFYIDNECNECGATLVYADLSESEDSDMDSESDDSVWFDEFVCSEGCNESIYMDWPDEEFSKLNARIEKFMEQDADVLTDIDDIEL